MGFPDSSNGKESTQNAGDSGLILGSGRFPGGGPGNPLSVFLPGESPWTEEPGRLQSKGSQRVRHDLSDLACRHGFLLRAATNSAFWSLSLFDDSQLVLPVCIPPT